MTNNDVLRRVRYTFDFSDDQMMHLFALEGIEVTRAQVSSWLKKDDDPDFVHLMDQYLAVFLNGFITLKRGKKEGVAPPPERVLSNNMILRKLKIALNLRDEDILEMLEVGGMKVSKHELSALFRNPKQRQYAECKDQFLRKFLYGMQRSYNSSNR